MTQQIKNKVSGTETRRKSISLFGIISAAALFLVFAASLRCGSVEISWQSVLDYLCSCGDNTSPEMMIINQLRMPRVLCAMLAGGAFAISGAVLQGVMRNPLASPEITGVSSGGAVAGLAAMLYFHAGANMTVIAVFSGALLAASGVYLLAWKNGTDPLRIILAGVAFSTLCGAAASTMIYLESDKAARIMAFTVGSFSSRSYENLFSVLPFAVSGFVLSVIMSKELDVLQLGDDTARSLGVKVEISRTLLLLASVLLAASAVSIAGLLGFAGLVVPHIVRLLSRGSNSRSLILRSAVSGAVFVALSDLVGKSIAVPAEIPAGVLTSLAGPPFFLWLLLKKRSIS